MVKSKFYNLDTDETLSSNSDYYVPSEKAIKTYVDTNIPTVNNATLTITQNGVSKGTFTANASSNVTIALDGGGGGGSYTAGTGINITNDVISVTSPTLTNTTSATEALEIKGAGVDLDLGTADNAIAISGYRAFAEGSYSIAIGYNIDVTGLCAVAIVPHDYNNYITGNYSVTIGDESAGYGNYSIAIGKNAYANEDYSIQLGKGTNTTAKTLAVGFGLDGSNNPIEYTLLDGTTGLIPDDRISSNIARSSAIPTVNDGTLTIQKNGTQVATFTANQAGNATANLIIPTTASDVNALPDTTTINDLTTSTQQAALNSGANSTNIAQITTNTNDISTINGKIPSAATTTNQLADKNFVNSSIATNTANFIGTFANVTDLEAYAGTVTNNDYAFVTNSVVDDNGAEWASFADLDNYDKTLLTNFDYAFVLNAAEFYYDLYRFNIVSQEWELKMTNIPEETDLSTIQLNTAYNRYKATVSGGTTSWEYEYTLNNSSFTAVQWAAINSGANTSNVTQITTNQNAIGTLSNLSTSTKTDLVSAINEVNGVASTAIQPNDNVSSLTNDAGYLTSSDLPSNHVTTDTDQNITGTKTFVGTKKIAFKQSGNSDKLGFTLYTSNNTEKGYLEFNPTNTIDGAPLMTLGNYASSAASLTQVGFRRYSSISGASGAYNLLIPMIADARTPFNLTTTYTNFYLPLGFTDGTTTIKTAKSGLVDISTLLPTVGNGTITINQGGTQKGTFTVNQSGNTTINLDSGGTVDQTYNASSTNAQSGTAVAEALSGFIQYAMVITDYTA